MYMVTIIPVTIDPGCSAFRSIATRTLLFCSFSFFPCIISLFYNTIAMECIGKREEDFMMDLIMKKNLNNAVERVLHVKGNYSGGILEMTFVIDCGLPKAYVAGWAADIAASLRAHSEVFRNVRLNLLYFKSDTNLQNKVVPFSFLQMSSCFADYQRLQAEKTLDALSGGLKLFHARSKLILVLAGENLRVEDSQKVHENMLPFLGKKSLFLFPGSANGTWIRGDGAERMLAEQQMEQISDDGES